MCTYAHTPIHARSGRYYSEAPQHIVYVYGGTTRRSAVVQTAWPPVWMQTEDLAVEEAGRGLSNVLIMHKNTDRKFCIVRRLDSQHELPELASRVLHYHELSCVSLRPSV